MLKDYKNKMMSEAVENKELKKSFSFTEAGVVIEANSYEEAKKILEKQLDKKGEGKNTY